MLVQAILQSMCPMCIPGNLIVDSIVDQNNQTSRRVQTTVAVRLSCLPPAYLDTADCSTCSCASLARNQ
jgi:hypothetical protein